MASTMPGFGPSLPESALHDFMTGQGQGLSENATPHTAPGEGQEGSEFTTNPPGSGRALPNNVYFDIETRTWRCTDLFPQALSAFGHTKPASQLRLACVIREHWLQPGCFALLGECRDFLFEILHVGAPGHDEGWAYVCRMVSAEDAVAVQGWVLVERLRPPLGYIGGEKGDRLTVLYAGEPGSRYAGSLYARRADDKTEGWIQSTRVQWVGADGNTNHVAAGQNTSLRVGCMAKTYREWKFPVQVNNYIHVAARTQVRVLHIGKGRNAGWVTVGIKTARSSNTEPQYDPCGWLPTNVLHVVPQRYDFAEPAMEVLQVGPVDNDGYSWLLVARSYGRPSAPYWVYAPAWPCSDIPHVLND